MAEPIKRDLFSLLKCGKLSEACRLIHSENLRNIKFTQSDAVRVFYNCYVAIVDDKLTSLNVTEDLQCLLSWAHQHVGILTKEDTDCILKTLYHILKFIISQENFEVLSSSREIIIPSCINDTSLDKHKKIYTNCCDLMHNFIARSHQKCDSDVLVEIAYTTVLMYSKVLPTTELLQTKVYIYLMIPKFDYKIPLYEKILALLENCNEYETLYPIIIKYTLETGDWIKQYTEMEIFFNMGVKFLHKKFPFDAFTKILMNLSEFMSIIPDGSKLTLADQKLGNGCKLLSEIMKKGVRERAMKETIALVSAIYNSILLHQKPVTIISTDIYSELLMTLSLTVEIKCTCQIEKTCAASLNVSMLLKTLQTPFHCLSMSSTPKVFGKLGELINKFVKEVLILKTEKCKMFENVYAAIVRCIYSVIYTIPTDSPPDHFVETLHKYVSFIIEGEGVNGKNFSILKSSIAILNTVYRHASNYKMSLLLNAFVIAISSIESDREPFMWEWLRSKKMEKEIKPNDETLEYQCFVTILEEHETVVKQLYKDFELTHELVIDLLKYELKQYIRCTRTKLSLGAFKLLTQRTNDDEFTSIVIDVFRNNCDIIKKDGLSSLRQCRNRLFSQLKRDCFDPNIWKVVTLDYMCYRIEQNELRNIALEEIVTNSRSSNENKDECDIKTLYEHLRISKCLDLFKYLIQALDLIHEQVEYISTDHLTSITKYQIHELLLDISIEFRIYCFRLQYLHTSLLNLKLSRILRNNNYILLNIAFMVEFTDPTSTCVKKLSEEAEEVIKDSDPFYIALYYLSKSMLSFRNCDTKNYISYYEKAQNLLTDISIAKYKWIVEEYLQKLKAANLMTPCNLRREGHDLNFLCSTKNALKDILERITKNIFNDWQLLIFFEKIDFFIEVLRYTKIPRELTLYCKQLVQLYIHLGIPLRAARAYFNLAYADIFTLRLDECRVKLQGMEYILCLSSKTVFPSMLIAKQKCKLEEKQVSSLNFDKLADSFHEMRLECPVVKKKLQKTCGSPTLFSEPCKQPIFLGHNPECICFQCMNVDFQTLVLSKFYIEYLLNIIENDLEVAGNCFQASRDLYTELRSKRGLFKQKANELVPCEFFEEIDLNLYDIMILTLLEGSKNFIRINEIEYAEKIHEILIDLSEECSNRNTFLLTQIHELKVLILLAKREKLQKDFQLKTPEPNFLKVEPVTEQKTPESKETRVEVPTITSPDMPPPRVKSFKPIKLDLLDSDDETSNQQSANQITPAKKKLKIYTGEDDVKSTRKKKLNSRIAKVKLETPSRTLAESLKEDCTVSKTKPAIKDLQMKSRTKLLTEKLKTTTTMNAPKIEIEEVQDSKPEGRSSRARKNLPFESASYLDNNIRRSTRIKK